MINKGMFTSKTPEWATPQHIFDELNKEFNFTLDPCATHENAKCVKYFTCEDNGLSKSWGGERVFMNPPYGTEIKEWMRKAFMASLNGAIVVCLVPARTDTKWWHCYAMPAWPHDIRLIKGRIKFVGSKDGPAPFGSAIVILRPPDKEMERLKQEMLF